MKLKIYPNLILRAPQFHLNALLNEEWEELKISIRNSSGDFYQIIKDVSAGELEQLPRPVYHSVWKYFNRAKYRATPYGSFAGFGIVHKGELNDDGLIRIFNKQILHKSICWTLHKEYLNNGGINGNTLLFANSSYYMVQDRLRYIVSGDNNTFDLAEVEALTDVIEILKDCRFPVAFTELTQSRNWNPNKTKLVKELVGLQLLFTDATANIIGPDYFERLGIKNQAGMPQYILAERKVESGYPAKEILRNIPKLIMMMNDLVNEFKSPALDHFKTEFTTKFNDRWVPLMQALDPELGISIAGNEEPVGDNSFIASFNTRVASATQEKKQVLETLLLNSVYEGRQATINLECIEHHFEFRSGKVPNSLSILCSIVDNNLVIEHIGGATALSVLGRYSIASEIVEDMCIKLANMEQQANPDVLFFDIAYTAEIVADNINRRRQLYPLQLSILNFDTSATPITLDDLYVNVQDNEIMLYSKSWKKRMIPRLSTAYNYNRSDLPLFRFLCELQYQGLKTNLGFNVSDLVPDVQHYPRVQYRNIILSPAKWKISFRDLQEHFNSSTENNIKSYLNKLGMQGYVLVRTDDRTLCFNTDLKTDLAELFYIIKKFGQFYLEEGFIPESAIVSDMAGNPYASQFIITIQQDGKVYEGRDIQLSNDHSNVQLSFPAGTEWLYYEIYTHPLRSDYILQDKIATFLKKHRLKISCWFFIRYKEGGEHIRLRMKLKNMNDLSCIMTDLVKSLEQELSSGIISDYRINKYQREVERYSPELIEDTEHLFFKDSRYVIALLQKMVADYDKYWLCIGFMFRIKTATVIEPGNFDRMIDRTTEYFLAEHEVKKDGFKQLNIAYKALKDHNSIPLTKPLKKQLDDFEFAFVNLLAKCPAERREKLFSDLMHMHINRLFSLNQRTHEMVIYYFMTKRIRYHRALCDMKTSAQ